MPLPFFIPAIGAATAGAVGTGIQALTGRKAAKKNRARIEGLQSDLGDDNFGLSEGERDQFRRELLAPQERVLDTQRRAADARLASRGPVSGADIAQVREEQQRGLGEATERAGLSVARADLDQADLERQRAQQELSQREAIDTQRKTDIADSLIGTLGSTAGALGQGFALSSLVESRKNAVAASPALAPEQKEGVTKLIEEKPEATEQAFAAVAGPQLGDTGPEVAELQQRLGITPDGVFGPATQAALDASGGALRPDFDFEELVGGF